MKQQLTGDLFDNAQEDSCATQSAMRAHIDFPKLPRLAIAQLLGGEWAREPVRSLADLSHSFSLLYHLPHTVTQRANEHRLGGKNVAPHSKRVDEVRPLFEDHGDAATVWYDAHRAHTPGASAVLLAAAGDMGTHLPPLKARQSAGDTTRVSITSPDNDELVILAPEVAKLRAVLAEHVAANTTPDDTGNGDSAASAQSQRGKGVPGVINTVTPLRGNARSSTGTSVSARHKGE